LEQEKHLQSPAANRIKRSPYFKLLFHQAWRQIVADREQPSHILVTAGERYGDHFQLEGSLSLSKGRYLHVISNLWLNEFISRPIEIQGDPVIDEPLTLTTEAETESLQFIQLPDVPLKPINEELLFEAEMLEPFPLFPASGLEESLPSLEFDELSLSLEAEETTPVPEPSLEQEEFIFDQQTPDYVSIRTVQLEEHRRMRSKELHYLDHPMLGVLIYIVPYELPERENDDSEIIAAPATEIPERGQQSRNPGVAGYE
jgi:hypothetical protein